MEVLITCLHLPGLFTPGNNDFTRAGSRMKAMPGEEKKRKKERQSRVEMFSHKK